MSMCEGLWLGNQLLSPMFLLVQSLSHGLLVQHHIGTNGKRACFPSTVSGQSLPGLAVLVQFFLSMLSESMFSLLTPFAGVSEGENMILRTEKFLQVWHLDWAFQGGSGGGP